MLPGHRSCDPLLLPRRWLVVPVVAATAYFTPLASALASVCYQLPFPNPNLDDGWGSTCCGRTSPHRGVDFPQGSGTAIPSVADGVVVINTWSNCLGNVIVVQHADGMFSGYSHMVVPSPLATGTEVAMGTQIGQVGATGTCAFGAHLHLSMSDHADGYGSGTTVDPYAYITTHTTCNEPPVGNLEHAGCDAIVGWAQDPNTPDAPIAAHVYFDGPTGDPAATSVATTADLVRADLCAMGWCYHTFRVPTPLRLLDGKPHAVHAYGIDDGGEANPELETSPRTLDCPPPTGMRRRITDDAVLTAWQFSTTDDLLTIDDSFLDSLVQTIALPPAPLLVRTDDGDPTVWLIDGLTGEHRRRIPDPAVASAWRFDLATATVWPAAQLAALDEAPPLRARPILVQGSGPERYVLDDSLEPLAGDSDSGPPHGGSEGSGDGSGTSDGDPPTSGGDDGESVTGTAAGSDEGSAGASTDDAGCGCRGTGTGAAWPGAAMLVLLGVRRRRSFV